MRLRDQALEKAGRGERISADEAFALATIDSPDDLHRLGQAATTVRTKRFGDRATYVFNLVINPSNICEGECGFCRYRAQVGDEHAYVLDEKEIFDRIEAREPTEVHIVGGMNEIWTYERSLELIRAIRQVKPSIHIKGFTAVEIEFFARKSGQSVSEVLESFARAGLNALPGGGAELFSERFRKEHCPSKLSAQKWLKIHRLAHSIGMTSNATMLYGFHERDEERDWVEHLLLLRETQDQSKGFRCFIPLSFQPGEGGAKRVSPTTDLKVIALSRLVLDNFDHIKAYWPMIGLETAAVALSWGADDLDGTLGEEKIAHAAGAKTPRALTRSRIEETIRLGGFSPVERNGLFEQVR